MFEWPNHDSEWFRSADKAEIQTRFLRHQEALSLVTSCKQFPVLIAEDDLLLAEILAKGVVRLDKGGELVTQSLAHRRATSTATISRMVGSAGIVFASPFPAKDYLCRWKNYGQITSPEFYYFTAMPWTDGDGPNGSNSLYPTGQDIWNHEPALRILTNEEIVEGARMQTTKILSSSLKPPSQTQQPTATASKLLCVWGVDRCVQV